MSAEPEALTDDLSVVNHLLNLAARIGLGSLTRVSVSGPLDRVPRTGPLILAPNHLSNADGVLIAGWLMPALGRRIHWLGKQEMLGWPVAGEILRRAGVHPVDRGAADVEAFRLARRIVDEGHVLIVFPEGTRSPTGGLQPAKDGLAVLALRTGAPILPLGIAGTNRFWPRGSHPHPGGRISLRIGDVFTLPSEISESTDRRSAKAAATELIMHRIAELLPQHHRGVYGDPSAKVAASGPE